MRPSRTGSTVVVALATVLGVVVAAPRAEATAPPAPPDCNGTTSDFANPTDVTIPETGVVSSDITVSGVTTRLQDVDVLTSILHPTPEDLDITVRSPAGTIVTLTTDNGTDHDNVLNGTLWDDDANPGGQVPYETNNGMVTDHSYSPGVVATPLVSEEPLGAFVGEDPNGVWTLTISDDLAPSGGTLTGWRLDLFTLATGVRTFAASGSGDVPGPFPVGTPLVSRTLEISGARPYLQDADLHTEISHTFPGDLDVTLTSPAGTVVTLTSDNGGDNDDVFDFKDWDDDFNPGGQVPYDVNPFLVTDHPFIPDDLNPLTPEEALAAFIGEDPNGIWTLTVSDDFPNLDGGTLERWSLAIDSAACARPDGRIRRGAGPMVGNEVYNLTGAGQTRAGAARPGGRVTYTVSAQNDATFGERLVIRGFASTPRFTVAYRSPTGANITAPVTGAGFTTPVLAPEGTYVVQVTVTVKQNAPASAQLTGLVRVRSSTNAQRTDVVRTVTDRL